MKELVHLVAEKTHISEEQAETAVRTVVGFLREKVPAPFAGFLDKMLGQEATEEATSEGTAEEKESFVSRIGSEAKEMFGRKKTG